MRRMWLLFLGMLVGLLTLVACAKATPTATPRPAVTPTVAATPTLLPTVPAIQFPKGEPKAGVYRTYEEATKDWPNVVAAAKKEGVVVISGWAPPPPGTPFYDMYDLFSKKYGIKWEFVGGRTAEQLARLTAEKATGKYSSDAYVSGPTSTRPVAAAGFADPFVPPGAFEPGVPWMVNPLAEGPHLGTGGTVFYWQSNPHLVNTAKVPQDKFPKSFKDLEDPYWKGKIAMEDPRNMGPIADYLDYVVRPEGVALGLGERHIKALFKNVARLYVGSGPAAEAVVKGDQVIAPMMPYSLMYTYAQLPKPWNWKMLHMEEGDMGWVISGFLIPGAPHPNTAKLLMEFMVSGEADKIRGSYYGMGLGRRDTVPVEPDVIPKKFFPVDYGDVTQTLIYVPDLIRNKVTPWLAELGF